MKNIKLGSLFCLLLIVLSGCSAGKTKFEPTKSSILLNKDGSVVSADIEALNKDHYIQEELVTFVESQVDLYNTERTGTNTEAKEDLPIMVEKCAITDQTATVRLKYETVEDYLAFNSTMRVVPEALFVGTIAEAKKAGYEFEGSFVKVKDNSPIDSSEAVKNEKQYVAVVEGILPVQVDGSILYMTDKVTKGEDSLVTGVDDVVSYIIFK